MVLPRKAPRKKPRATSTSVCNRPSC
jgi:hypothetical protein